MSDYSSQKILNTLGKQSDHFLMELYLCDIKYQEMYTRSPKLHIFIQIQQSRTYRCFSELESFSCPDRSSSIFNFPGIYTNFLELHPPTTYYVPIPYSYVPICSKADLKTLRLYENIS